jgi:hypothetical protein
MSIREKERSAYYTPDGGIRVYCGRCDYLTHAFYGYTKRDAARRTQRGEACAYFGPR